MHYIKNTTKDNTHRPSARLGECLTIKEGGAGCQTNNQSIIFLTTNHQPRKWQKKPKPNHAVPSAAVMTLSKHTSLHIRNIRAHQYKAGTITCAAIRATTRIRKKQTFRDLTFERTRGVGKPQTLEFQRLKGPWAR